MTPAKLRLAGASMGQPDTNHKPLRDRQAQAGGDMRLRDRRGLIERLEDPRPLGARDSWAMIDHADDRAVPGRHGADRHTEPTPANESAERRLRPQTTWAGD